MDFGRRVLTDDGIIEFVLQPSQKDYIYIYSDCALIFTLTHSESFDV